METAFPNCITSLRTMLYEHDFWAVFLTSRASSNFLCAFPLLLWYLFSLQIFSIGGHTVGHTYNLLDPFMRHDLCWVWEEHDFKQNFSECLHHTGTLPSSRGSCESDTKNCMEYGNNSQQKIFYLVFLSLTTTRASYFFFNLLPTCVVLISLQVSFFITGHPPTDIPWLLSKLSKLA